MVQLSGIGFYNQQGNFQLYNFLFHFLSLTLFTFTDESLDVDPNYDPSDFLHMGKKQIEQDYMIDLNIKQESKSYKDNSQEQQSSSSSFNMSEMLMYERKSIKSEMSIHTEESGQYQQVQQTQSQITEFTTQESHQSTETSQIIVTEQQSENIDVGIHDDLAISDSDEEEQEQQHNISKSHSENPDNDDDLWF